MVDLMNHRYNTSIKNSFHSRCSPHSMNQSQLVQKAKNGDHHAFKILIQPLQSKIYHRALKALTSPHDAEDVMQETLIRAYSKLYTFRQDALFSSWVYQICTRQIIVQFRKRAQQRRQVQKTRSPHEKDHYHDQDHFLSRLVLNQQTGVYVDAQIVRSQPEHDCLWQEKLHYLEQGIQQLEAPYKYVLQLWLQGYDLNQIQQSSHLSRNAVKSRLHRARKSIKVYLDALDFEEFIH